jgi:hypothetical protein
MSEIKSVVRYDYNYLQQYCKENGIELLGDYSKEKVNRNTIIEAKCFMENCNDNVNKTFNSCVNHGGFYCKKCTKTNGVKKNKQIFLEKYGVEHPSQSTLIKEKSQQTCLNKYGVIFSFQSKELKDKAKQTCLNKYGVEHNSQTQQFKEKIKKTNLEKYGVENAFQSQEVKDKAKQTCLNKYGVEHVSYLLDVKNKKIETCLNKYGVIHQSQSQQVKDKCKNTFLEKYGVECSLQSEEVKDKIRQTNLEKYGVENAQQNAEVAEKSAKNAYKSKDYIFPSGRIERIQGYEHYMLSELLQQENILEDDILVSRKEVPSVWYEDANGTKRRYFVDCFIKSQNRCIETKSIWTAEKKKDCIFLKQQALKDAGYECEIWVYNSKGEKVECYK